ncbi:transcriptional regulator [Puia dinghuensis]|uniref:Transcriptional regulator n=2 Tax=Puia dinghuensis TaxID=1792502 RepID=A0A8J2XVQ9_9BACT|nr:transcriptional regulator [Puia dinghuensis]
MTSSATALQSEEKDTPLKIQTLQELYEQRAGGQEMPHRHQDTEILWIRNGKGSLEIDLKKYNMGSNTLYCISPGQLHQLEPGEQAEGYLISFPEYLVNSSGDEMELVYRFNLFHLLTTSPGISMQPELADEMDEIVRRLYKETHHGNVLSREIIRRYTSIFLIYIARQLDGAMQLSLQSRNVKLVRSFIELLEKNYMNWKLVKNYAGELSVTANYLNEVVKKISGFSAGYHIRRRVVLEAKRRAVYSNDSMKQIAHWLGFEDTAHFSKFFKAVYGKNFSDFKKENYSPIS